MDTDALRQEARFKVGDTVWTKSSGPWTITGRYWSRVRGCITYDLTYNYNGVVLHKQDEQEVFADRQWIGINKDRA